MGGNTFGQIFRITSFGESHGKAVGVVIDGCPPNIKISKDEIQKELDRRRPGQNALASPRREEDKVEILSGIENGNTLGTPICLLIRNKDINPKDYEEIQNIYRPSHADYTYEVKYGVASASGGGRSSARETAARVAAGAVAQKFLREKLNIRFASFVEQVGNIKAIVDIDNLSRQDIENSLMRCPDIKAEREMEKLIKSIQDSGDSVGGIIKGVIKNVPPGLGEPVFDKLSADLAKAMLSINAVKGFDIGSGFESITKLGSQNNDEFHIDSENRVRTKTNNSGGIQAGISNGETIYFRVAFKPVSTIRKIQKTVTRNGKSLTFSGTGRHDPCVLPRAVPIIDAMGALVVMDHYLRYKSQRV